MREIKFRVETVLACRWTYGHYAYVDGYHVIYEEENPYIIKLTTLGQYTGLKDKNGVEIYEGDIVKTSNQNNIIKKEYGSFIVAGLHDDKYERTYSDMRHYLIDRAISDMEKSKFDGVTTYLEIVGNIYQS